MQCGSMVPGLQAVLAVQVQGRGSLFPLRTYVKGGHGKEKRFVSTSTVQVIFDMTHRCAHDRCTGS